MCLRQLWTVDQNSEQKYEAQILMNLILLLDFVFNIHLMKNMLGITNELSQVLQRKDHNIRMQ